jgi:hypothetical protein
MAKPLIAAIFLLMASLCDAAAAPVPEAGAVQDGGYRNAYFGFSLALPAGWSEGTAGPPPSLSGYYVLANLTGPDATLLIAAQDLFFGDKPFTDAAGMTDALRMSLRDIPDLQGDPTPQDVTIGGHAFRRLDYDAGGLYRSWFATDLRCHVLLFTITAPSPEERTALVGQLGALTFKDPAAPACAKGYATDQAILHKVEPPEVKPKGMLLPARVTIDADGTVQQVHVLRAAPALKDGIIAALLQWRFRPYAPDGHPVALETGLLIGEEPRAP